LAGLTNLHVLELSGTALTDVGLDYLQGLGNLYLLELAGTQVSDDGIARVEQSLPATKVKR